MLLQLSKIISQEQVTDILSTIEEGEFISGSSTAAGSAARVKNNLQLAPNSEVAMRAGQILLAQLRANPVFQAATYPAAVTAPRFSRYEPGMNYGDHLDSPLMGESPRMRADISVTVFLNSKDDYDGGELVISTDYGVERCKGNAGDCVIYPASTLHRVEPVKRGVRLVAFLWIQSLIRDPAQRKLIFDLVSVLEYLDHNSLLGEHIDKLRRCHLNLIRMWAEP